MDEETNVEQRINQEPRNDIGRLLAPIRYVMVEDAHVLLQIYTLLGEEVVSLVDRTQQAGVQYVMWDGQTKQRGYALPGTYQYMLTITPLNREDCATYTGQITLVR